jgi:hypothetical protein
VIFDVCELISTNLITEVSAKQHLSPLGLPALPFGPLSWRPSTPLHRCFLSLVLPTRPTLGGAHGRNPFRGRSCKATPSVRACVRSPAQKFTFFLYLPTFGAQIPDLALNLRSRKFFFPKFGILLHGLCVKLALWQIYFLPVPTGG